MEALLINGHDQRASYSDSPAGGRPRSSRSGSAGSAPLPCGTGTGGTAPSPCHRRPGLSCRCCGDTGKAGTPLRPQRGCQRSPRHSPRIWSLLSNQTKGNAFSLGTQGLVHPHSCPESVNCAPHHTSYPARGSHISRGESQASISNNAAAWLRGHSGAWMPIGVPAQGLLASHYTGIQQIRS